MFLKLTCCLIFLVTISIFPAISYSSSPSLFDALSFETKQTSVRPLNSENLTEAREVDASDSSFVQVINEEIEEKLTTQERILGNSAIRLGNAWEELAEKTLYCGVFCKEKRKLLGVFEIKSCFHSFVVTTNEGGLSTAANKQNDILHTHAKYHKDYQGRGYGTEVKKSLFIHYQKLKLIPSSLEDNDVCAFQGFSGLIHLRNKPSLAYNIINCGYKVGRLLGDRVEVYYPFVNTAKYSHFGLFADLTLHERIAEDLIQYLSRDTAEESKLASEKALRAVSLANLMSVEQSLLPTALDSESGFILSALGQFPDLLESLSVNQINLINTAFKKGDLGKVSLEEIPEKERQFCIDYINNFREAKRNMVILLLKSWIKSNPKLSSKSTRPQSST
jgi:hypothetical protein